MFGLWTKIKKIVSALNDIDPSFPAAAANGDKNIDIENYFNI